MFDDEIAPYSTPHIPFSLVKMNEKRSFLLSILSYGYLSGLRSDFKSCKIPYSIQIQKDTGTCISQKAEVKIEIEWEKRLCNFWNSTLSHSMTYNSANHHCIARVEVSKCAGENCASDELIQFWHTAHFVRCWYFWAHISIKILYWYSLF